MKYENADLFLNTNAREKLMAGITKLYKAVSITLGPKGRVVVIKKENDKIHTTKDGVTVAKELALKDPVEMMGAQMIREAAMRTADNAGDGTTSATVLAYKFIVAGNALIKEGKDPNQIRAEWEILKDLTIANILRKRKRIKKVGQLCRVATISANNDKVLGRMVGELVFKMGKNGIITIEKGTGLDTIVSHVHGLQIDAPYASPYLVNAPKIMSTVYAKTKVFIYNGDLYNLKEIITILDYCHSNSDPVLILTTNVDDSVIQMAVENVIANKVKWVFPKLIGTPEQKKAIMDDIAILSGANVFEKGKHQFNVNELDYWLGTIDRVENNDLHLTVVVGDKVNKSDLDRHIGDLKKEITTTSNEMTKMFLNQRINKLQGGVAVIYVGGATDLEIIERKDRVEDAVLAAKSALKEGVVEGGGWALYEAAEELKGDVFVQAFKQVLSHPKELIFANAGIVFDNTKQDLHSGVSVTSMYAAGIIDPAIVVREALENAFSVAMIVLLTEAVIYKEYPIISGPPRLNTPAFPQKQ